jgi:hypothetical protein
MGVGMAQLSDQKCQTAKPGNAVRKLSDGDGLQLWIMPTGAKLWRLAYRYDEKQKLLAIGPYLTVSLVSHDRNVTMRVSCSRMARTQAHRRSSTRPRGSQPTPTPSTPRRRLSG